MKRRQQKSFSYHERAAQARAAHEAVDIARRAAKGRHSAKDQKARAWNDAIERFRKAVSEAYPPGFWVEFEALKEGDVSALDTAVSFLHADPWFYRSGYVKQDLIRFVNRLPLGARDFGRLQDAVLNAVDQRDRREFRSYCRLARRVVDSDLIRALEERLQSPDPGVCRRARWALDALRSKTKGPQE